MIKVIASDMDGTLLNNNHVFSEKTIESLKRACKQGIRFMVVTGRNYVSALEPLGKTDLVCDYILSSGAEIRNPKQEVWLSLALSFDQCEYLYEKIKKYPLGIMFCSEEKNYIIGSFEEADQGILDYIKYFHDTKDRDELRKSPLYKMMWDKTKEVKDFEALRKNDIPITKMFLVSDDVDMLQTIKIELEEKGDIAVSSSFKNNLEVTDIRAQKGPILKKYIESLGYTMDEVMVLGDSLNDYSMMEMDFGATIAMANADEEIKKLAKYITKSNEEDGVAYVIDEMLKMYGME
ncbi:MAG: HAD family phosphatase [Lachnospiraceae bacterium]|nr:HAD family phosphatase [Lachnospiraceae bacterium]